MEPSSSPPPTTPTPVSDQDALQLLSDEFRRLDSALIAAVYCDTRDVEKARETLSILDMETAMDEISLGAQQGSPPAASSCPEWGDWTSETDPTTMSLHEEFLYEDDDDDEEEEEEEELDPDVAALRGMFPQLPRYALVRTLERARGDIARATDELLNRTLLEGEGAGKGVDAFAEVGGGRKRKGKAPKRRVERSQSLPLQRSVVREPEPVASVWDKKSEEVADVAEALGLPKPTVTSVHHSTGGSLPKTLARLLDTYGGESVGDSEEHMAELEELVSAFGGEVQREHLDRLLRLCCENKVAVFRLAELLRRNPPEVQVRISPPEQKRTPNNHPHHHHHHRKRDVDENWVAVGGNGASRQNGTDHPNSSFTSSPTSSLPVSYYSAAHLSDAYRHARNEAFQKAAESYRRSRSDRLMGGAAAFYADLGKDYNVKTKEYDNLAAERYVAGNSGDDVLDLHGVTVAQAVKIAKERTTQWWVSVKPDERGRRIRPFRIVTGVGRHSKGGEAKLGPAVTKMLVREGWIIGTGVGEVMVYGVKGK